MVRVIKIDGDENFLDTIDVLYREVWNQSIKERLKKHFSHRNSNGESRSRCAPKTQGV